MRVTFDTSHGDTFNFFAQALDQGSVPQPATPGRCHGQPIARVAPTKAGRRLAQNASSCHILESFTEELAVGGKASCAVGGKDRSEVFRHDSKAPHVTAERGTTVSAFTAEVRAPATLYVEPLGPPRDQGHSVGGTSACTEGDADSGAAHSFALSGSPPGEPEANDPYNLEFENYDECSRTDAEAGNLELLSFSSLSPWATSPPRISNT